jgi:N-acetyl-anhydromuramyl-L-alanine amidase AmpD
MAQSIPECYTSWAEEIAKNSSHGYSQLDEKRWGPDYDCSSLVISAIEQAGIELRSKGADDTSNSLQPLLDSGFEDILANGTVKSSSTENMKRGDILLRSKAAASAKGGHMAIYCGNNKIVEASGDENGGDGKSSDIDSGDQVQQGTKYRSKEEIGINPYQNGNWTNILRYTGTETAKSSGTVSAPSIDKTTYRLGSGSEHGAQTPQYVVMHWAINTTCQGIYNQFKSNQTTSDSSKKGVAAHYAIGNDGSIFQMVDDNIQCWHSKSHHNKYSIGIESCTKSITTGEYTEAGYNANVHLAAYLCKTYNINPSTNLLRHYDCSGKACPRWFAPNPDYTDSGVLYPKNSNCDTDWAKFKSDVANKMNGLGSSSGLSVEASYFSGVPTDTSDMSASAMKQIEQLKAMGLDAYASGSDIMINYSILLKDYIKYANVRLLKGLQYHPNSLGRFNYKQDYVVIIRKKLYFAGTVTSEENYLRLYQLNNFSAITVSTSVAAEGTASVSIKGAERVVCIDRADETNKNWQSWDEMLNGLTNIDNEAETNGTRWRIGNSEWNDPNSSGIDYKNLMKAREAKYGWKFAEKCDFEPMDEIIIFSQSRSERNSSGQFTFKKIFFGYINSVQKDYSTKGLTMTIQASDQLKLLRNSYVNKSASYQPGIYNNGYLDISFATDKFGMIKLKEPYSALMAAQGEETSQDSINEVSQRTVWSEIFCGLFPDIIIANACMDAGIPARYLVTRIEPVKVIPYIFKDFTATPDYFSTEFKSRLQYCQEIAEICFMEFFQDEDGNIVFKIPSYVLGCNNLTSNNMGYELDLSFRENIGAKLDKSDVATLAKIQALCEYCQAIIYTTVEGDTLANISVDLYGTSIYASEIKYLNVGTLQKYSANDLIDVGTKILVFSYDVKDSKAREEYTDLLTNSFVSTLATTLYNEQTGIIDVVNMIGVTNSMLTDPLIPQVLPNEIISFVLSDCDSGIYNSIDMNSETFMNVYDNSGADLKMKRTVPEIDSIIHFGVRVAPSTTTPLINAGYNLELLGHLILAKSAASRFTATLSMVENPDIRVGNPIRLFTYDEHPQMETGLWSTDTYPEQSVYYINSISRSIKADGVSTMSIDLVGGRMMGEESIYDKMSVLYLGFYVMPNMNDATRALAEQYYSENWGKITSSSEVSLSTNSDGSGGTDDGITADNSNAVGYCFNTLKNRLGINTAAICGVLGNLWVESKFNPAASNKGSHLGLAQWDSVTRYPRMKKYCSENGYDYKTVKGQIEYVCYEMKNSYVNTYNYLKGLSNTESSVTDAADYVRLHYEVCDEQGAPQRRSQALNYWKTYKES